MSDYPPPLCHYCARRFAGDDETESDALHCQAFPDGIPERILHSEADHRKPYRGDGGLRYESGTDQAPDDAYWDKLFAPVPA